MNTPIPIRITPSRRKNQPVGTRRSITVYQNRKFSAITDDADHDRQRTGPFIPDYPFIAGYLGQAIDQILQFRIRFADSSAD